MKKSIRLLFSLALCLGLALPAFAADGAGFDPTSVSVKSTGGIPVGTVITWPSNSWPSDADKWLECNGQSISSTVYPELVGVVGSRLPDYRGRFLRGASSGHSVGQTVANSIKSHNHTQPAHTHSFSGQLVSTALSGTAAGQRYTDSHTGLDGRGTQSGPEPSVSFGIQYVSGVSVSGEGVTASVSYGNRQQNAWLATRNKTANSSSVSGNLRNGTVSGSIGRGGDDPTDYTGSTETAPDHIYVRCLIRAKP